MKLKLDSTKLTLQLMVDLSEKANESKSRGYLYKIWSLRVKDTPIHLGKIMKFRKPSSSHFTIALTGLSPSLFLDSPEYKNPALYKEYPSLKEAKKALIIGLNHELNLIPTKNEN
jgi:hypothetical protein